MKHHPLTQALLYLVESQVAMGRSQYEENLVTFEQFVRLPLLTTDSILTQHSQFILYYKTLSVYFYS